MFDFHLLLFPKYEGNFFLSIALVGQLHFQEIELVFQVVQFCGLMSLTRSGVLVPLVVSHYKLLLSGLG